MTTELSFKIEHVSSKPERGYVIARHLGQSNFVLSQRPLLAGTPIVRAVTQPRAIKADGMLDLSLFVFQLVEPAHTVRFSLGQIVELSP